MLNTTKNIFFNNRDKDIVFSEIEKFLTYLDDLVLLQDKYFHQVQLNLVEKAIKVFNAEINEQQLTKDQALTIFKDALLQQIKIDENPQYFTGLKSAINDYFTNK